MSSGEASNRSDRSPAPDEIKITWDVCRNETPEADTKACVWPQCDKHACSKCLATHQSGCDLRAVRDEEDAVRTEVQCHFFSKGKCSRGASCPFQHASPADDTKAVCSVHQKMRNIKSLQKNANGSFACVNGAQCITAPPEKKNVTKVNPNAIGTLRSSQPIGARSGDRASGSTRRSRSPRKSNAPHRSLSRPSNTSRRSPSPSTSFKKSKLADPVSKPAFPRKLKTLSARQREELDDDAGLRLQDLGPPKCAASHLLKFAVIEKLTPGPERIFAKWEKGSEPFTEKQHFFICRLCKDAYYVCTSCAFTEQVH